MLQLIHFYRKGPGFSVCVSALQSTLIYRMFCLQQAFLAF